MESVLDQAVEITTYPLASKGTLHAKIKATSRRIHTENFLGLQDSCMDQKRKTATLTRKQTSNVTLVIMLLVKFDVFAGLTDFSQA